MDELQHQLSDASLQLLPEYQQRLEVLKRLRYINEDHTVQLKVGMDHLCCSFAAFRVCVGQPTLAILPREACIRLITLAAAIGTGCMRGVDLRSAHGHRVGVQQRVCLVGT